MANYDVQVVLKHANGLPSDVFVNTLHYEVNAPDTLEGVSDEINAAYVGINSVLASYIQGMDIKWYEPGANPEGPTFSKTYTTPDGGSSAAPAEVACCLSYATVDDPESSLPRRRGRIYVGPFGAGAVGAERPTTAGVTDFVLDLGEALASVGTAGNTTWLMYSQSDAAYAKIESIWCDDAWDVQRRRGAAPTSREVRDVQ